MSKNIITLSVILKSNPTPKLTLPNKVFKIPTFRHRHSRFDWQNRRSYPLDVRLSRCSNLRSVHTQSHSPIETPRSRPARLFKQLSLRGGSRWSARSKKGEADAKQATFRPLLSLVHHLARCDHGVSMGQAFLHGMTPVNRAKLRGERPTGKRGGTG